jgi:hypothetical protein
VELRDPPRKEDIFAGPMGFLCRTGCALFGFVCAMGALLIFFEVDGLMFSPHPLGLLEKIRTDLQIFPLVAIFASAGLLIAGIPVVPAVPPRVLLRLRWPWILIIGAGLGIFALIGMFIFMSGGRITADTTWRVVPKWFHPLFSGGFLLTLLPLLTTSAGFAGYNFLLRWVDGRPLRSSSESPNDSNVKSAP